MVSVIDARMSVVYLWNGSGREGVWNIQNGKYPDVNLYTTGLKQTALGEIPVFRGEKPPGNRLLFSYWIHQ